MKFSVLNCEFRGLTAKQSKKGTPYYYANFEDCDCQAFQIYMTEDNLYSLGLAKKGDSCNLSCELDKYNGIHILGVEVL